jgi:hypothetical protein
MDPPALSCTYLRFCTFLALVGRRQQGPDNGADRWSPVPRVAHIRLLGPPVAQVERILAQSTGNASNASIVGASAGAGGVCPAAACPTPHGLRYPHPVGSADVLPARGACSRREALGVTTQPTWRLNRRVRWLWWAKPAAMATGASGRSACCSKAYALRPQTQDTRLRALVQGVAEQAGELIRAESKGRATLAVAHVVLVILYHMLRDQKPATDLGANYFDRLDTERLQHRSVQRLEQLGYSVTLTPAPAA